MLMNLCEELAPIGVNTQTHQTHQPLGGENSKQKQAEMPKLVQLLRQVQLFDQVRSGCQNWFWDGLVTLLVKCGEKSS